jgi:hypothetical protein
MTLTRRVKRVDCKHCTASIGVAGLKKHEEKCYLNPKNKKECPVCGTPVRNYKKTVTCSRSCANTYYRSGDNNPNWKESSYRSTCFHNHEKKCVVCSEQRIVEVHHYDGNSRNNLPENLIPLCPTHHKYWHSRYRDLIKEQVESYREAYLQKRNIVSG